MSSIIYIYIILLSFGSFLSSFAEKFFCAKLPYRGLIFLHFFTGYKLTILNFMCILKLRLKNRIPEPIAMYGTAP